MAGRCFLFSAIVFFSALATCVANAGTISVSPVLLDVVTERDVATSLTVSNASEAASNIQVRVFRWRQIGGQDVLEPTNDVVVSPPMARLSAGSEQLVRVIRLSKRDVQGEEAYRLIIDEIPMRSRSGPSSVSLVVRQSIPLFFRSPAAMSRPLRFTIGRRQQITEITAQNSGETRQRVTSLKVLGEKGSIDFARSGLAGYVLGGSIFSWSTSKMTPGPKTVSFSTESGVRTVPAKQQ